VDVSEIASDLADEQAALDSLVSSISDADWDLMTPSPRWRIRDQVAHLAYFDETAELAVTDPEGFGRHVEQLAPRLAEGDEAMDQATIGELVRLSAPELLDRWRKARAALANAAAGLTDEDRIPWYGPAMGSKSFLTARLMETWAHGQDVADALGVERNPTGRLAHIVNLGLRTRAWAYLNRGQTPPDSEVQLRLTSPSGEIWELGSDDATDLVTGTAEDFCLVVTQRRHVDDTTLEATVGARQWLEIAQAFAGPPTQGPERGTRP
jgi:uncharacterized protein (TIGR03084 family)